MPIHIPNHIAGPLLLLVAGTLLAGCVATPPSHDETIVTTASRRAPPPPVPAPPPAAAPAPAPGAASRTEMAREVARDVASVPDDADGRVSPGSDYIAYALPPPAPPVETVPVIMPPPPPPAPIVYPPPPAPVVYPPPPPPNGGPQFSCAGLRPFTLSPPRPSAQMLTLANQQFLRPGAKLQGVASQLSAELEEAGYEERGFFCVPGGFVLATRLERIRPDKTPFPGDGRWRTGPNSLLQLQDGFSLSRIIDALVNADPGRYRMMLFYVTNRQVTPSNQPAQPDIMNLPGQGADVLPDQFGGFAYTAAYRVRALIYEFARPSVAAPPAFVPQTVPARTHLRRAGLTEIVP